MALPVRIVRVPGAVDIRAIRLNPGLSQAEFASQYGFNVRTIQQWEQRRSEPDTVARAYLTVILQGSAGGHRCAVALLKTTARRGEIDVI